MAAAMDEMKREILTLRREANALNSPDTFAQSAKLSRKAKALEKKLKQTMEKQAERNQFRSRAFMACKVRKLSYCCCCSNRLHTHPTSFFVCLLFPFQWLTFATIIALNWGSPMFQIDETIQLWPLTYVLKWPDLRVEGMVSAFSFLLILNRVLSIVLQKLGR